MSKKCTSCVKRRAEELDTIAAVLPLERRDELAELLTDEDVAMLRHLMTADGTVVAVVRFRDAAGIV